MSLKPRSIDFQETWASLKETVAGVVGLRSVERGVWNNRFSDVYALCVAQPEPLADRLYEETKTFLEEHVSGLFEKVRGNDDLLSSDHQDGLLTRYCTAWKEYSQGVAYLNSLYSYLNLQHIKRQKVSEAELVYGNAAPGVNGEQEHGQLEVGELGLWIWERVLVRPLARALTLRSVAALTAARAKPLEAALHDALRLAVDSLVQAQAYRVRRPLALYERLVLEPYLQLAETQHARRAAQLLEEGDVAHYMKEILQELERETAVGARYLVPRGAEAVRRVFERAAVEAHLPALHAECPALLRAAAHEQRRGDLARLYALLQPLGAAALKPLVDAAREQAARDGRALLAAADDREPQVRFVRAVLELHQRYSALFASVFNGAQVFAGALDRACAEVVNARDEHGVCRAPELVARYCDALLRRRRDGGAAATSADADGDELAAAILVFKYVDDKDVFQKHYARALARRLIHQLSNSMEQEEAMIERLKATCGYEFTNKLHRMFTDVAVSADLNAKFAAHARAKPLGVGFSVAVLQAGAWPLAGAASPLAPPPRLELPARAFEAFYRSLFSGRRLAWLHHLCTGELRALYVSPSPSGRPPLLCATAPQCALLLHFDAQDEAEVGEAQQALRLAADTWLRHARPLVDAGLLLLLADAADAPDAPDALARPSTLLRLNLAFTSKRHRIKLTAAPAPPGSNEGGSGGGSGNNSSESTQCDDDRKMYLQAALVRIMKQRKVLRHNDLIQEVVCQARGSFAPSVAMIKKCIEALIDKQYIEREPGRLDTYSYLA